MMRLMCTYDLAAFPRLEVLPDQTELIIRPMVPEDAEALLTFFQELPEEDQCDQQEEVTSPEVIRRWARQLDYDHALPLLALACGGIVAYATLLRSRAAARRHVGEIRIVVHPTYREQGVAMVLMHDLMAIAHRSGPQLLTFEAVCGHQDESIRSARWLGFRQAAVLKGRVQDPVGRLLDVVVMEASIGTWFEWWPFRAGIAQVRVRLPWEQSR